MFKNPAINRIYNSLDTKGLTNKEPVFPTLRCQFTSLEGNLFCCLHDLGYVSLDTDKRSFEWLLNKKWRHHKASCYMYTF